MNRRHFLSTLTALAVCAPFSALAQSNGVDTVTDRDWTAWKAAFLMPDGRVVDHLQDQSTHSEGQGYGLVLSVIHGDRAAFDAIWSWTSANLNRRNDALLNWKLVPGQTAPEAMNATDGDLFFAWGLAMGADRFDIPKARFHATEIAKAISAHCVHPDPRNRDRLILLPAAEGFLRGTKAIINPSYIMPRALNDLSALIRDPRLAQVANDGLVILDELAKSTGIPNWAEVDIAGLRPSSEHMAHYGYDAVRVPLYLIWSGHRDHAAVAHAKEIYASASGQNTPVVVDLKDRTVLDTSTYDGFAAVHRLVDGRSFDTPELDVGQGYYPAMLDMLSRVADRETAPALTFGLKD